MSFQPHTWFITGAARGIGAHTVQAALAAGHNVVATARKRENITLTDDRLLALDLDVTDAAQAQAAVQSAVAHFGRIDVLVNNAGYGQLGLFEESTVADAQAQFATNVFGLFHVTRAVLPVMRQQRAGHVLNISSMAGIRGRAGTALYSASKFAVEGFSEGLAQELAPFGIRVTIVEPGAFRTDFLDGQSMRFGSQPIADYAAQSAQINAGFGARNHMQPGDPARLAAVLLQLAAHPKPPLRFAAGSDAVEIIGAKIEALRGELEAWQALSVTTDGEF
ncbi:NADP-dependent 3-hydroxy acid dehydrogenase YdfG [Rhodoferax sp. OV413]|uniref:oxidoreductase n=1 Tax=Rhodoferax sp. OV413 TaxID=1855285 RepID=UPI00088C0C7F|nr:oxidoreductase [Rhodoferax sp. OV413]SDP94389.1 NADP-dependent 3-hydroxy acid dehydrogenase YdfG [Rhodoferax sp. OV413]